MSIFTNFKEDIKMSEQEIKEKSELYSLYDNLFLNSKMLGSYPAALKNIVLSIQSNKYFDILTTEQQKAADVQESKLDRIIKIINE